MLLLFFGGGVSATDWPATVNQLVYDDGYGEDPQRDAVSFKPGAGAAIERMRTSIATDLVTFAGRLTSAEYDDLITFYRDNLGCGVLPFTRAHPRTGDDADFTFVDAPKITRVEGLTLVIAFSLRLMP